MEQGNRSHQRSRCRHAVVIALVVSLAGIGATQEPVRNAIFNGDFVEGRAGWSIGGPPDVQISTHRTMIADRADAELALRHGALAETMTLFSQHPITVRPGRDYTLALTAAGQGTVDFGVYEYDERGKNTVFPLSEAIALTTEPRTHTYTYTASEQASTIRPRIRIIGRAPPKHEPVTPTDTAVSATAPFHVRLLNFELMLTHDEFRETTNWPDWAVSGELTRYQGLSVEEVRQIEDAVRVERVLPPFEPIRADRYGVYKLTTSDFRFSRSVLPESISILGQEVLAGGIMLDMKMADGTLVARSLPRAAVTADDRQVRLRQTTRGEGWTLNLTGTLLYDALLIVDIELDADEEVEVVDSSVSLTIPDKVAKYIRYHKDFPDGRYRFGYGPIPAAGETVETRLIAGRAKIRNDWQIETSAPEHGTLWEWSHGAPRYFWIGDEQRGLGWITESDQGWSNGVDDVTWQLERTDQGLTARMHIISRPTTVTGTWSTRFMLQAMPPKPVRQDWFKMRFNRFWNWRPGDARMIERIEAMRTEGLPTPAEDPPGPVRYAQAGGGESALRPPWESLSSRGLKDIGFLWWDVWSVGCGSPRVANPDIMRSYLDAGSYVGHTALPYFAPTHLSVNDLNGYYYAAKTDTWAKAPPSGGTSAYVKICPNSFASAYQAYEIGRLIDEYGIEGVYFDNTHPSPCSNLEHGCGWVDGDGVTHPTTPFLGMRNIFMMIREQFVKRGQTPFIFKHAGAFPAEVSFVDANLDGEGIYGYDHTELFTPAEFRAQWIGPNQFGLVQVYLPQFSIGTDTSEVSGAQQIAQGTRRLMALALIHGTPIYCGAIQAFPMHKAWEVLDQLHAPTVEFIPYWDWRINGKLNQRDIYASVYHQPEQSVLVVANLSSQDQGIAIPRDELDLCIPGFTTARDEMDHQSVVLDEDSLRLSIANRNFRLISVR